MAPSDLPAGGQGYIGLPCKIPFFCYHEKRMKLLLSSYTLEPFPLEETFLLAQEVGADGLELVLTPAVYRLGLSKIKELSEKYNLPIFNLHQPPWGVFYTGKRGVRKMIKQAQSIGAQNIVVHLATVRRSFNSPFFGWIKRIEKESGINIAFENAASRSLEKWPRYAGEPEKLEKFIQAQNINLTLDVTKAFLAGMDPYQFFQRNRTHIPAMHFHGFSNGDYHIGFRGRDFDWPGFMSFIKKYDYAGTVTLEVFPMHKLFYFDLPSREKLEAAKEIVRVDFAVLKRA